MEDFPVSSLIQWQTLEVNVMPTPREYDSSYPPGIPADIGNGSPSCAGGTTDTVENNVVSVSDNNDWALAMSC